VVAGCLVHTAEGCAGACIGFAGKAAAVGLMDQTSG